MTVVSATATATCRSGRVGFPGTVGESAASLVAYQVRNVGADRRRRHSAGGSASMWILEWIRTMPIVFNADNY